MPQNMVKSMTTKAIIHDPSSSHVSRQWASYREWRNFMPTKSHRMPLSVAKPMMKNTKRREEKKMEEEKLLGVFTKRRSNSKVEKRQPQDKVLKATEGYFSKGVLNVKHLLEPKLVKRDEGPSKKIGKPKKGKGKKRSKGKRKG